MTTPELDTLRNLYNVTRRACDACRMRKIRCVRNLGDAKCKACDDKNADCLYVLPPVKKKKKPKPLDDPSQDPEPRGITFSPEELERTPSVSKIAVAEPLPVPTSGPSIYKHQYLMGGNSDFEEAFFVDILSSGSMSLLPTGLGNPLSRTVHRVSKDVVFLEVHDDEAKLQQRKAKLDEIYALVGDSASKLLYLYFRTVHSSFPILDKEEFLSTYTNSFHSISPALLACLYLFALNWWSLDSELSMMTPPSQKELENIAESCLYAELGSASLATVQAGLLLIQHQSFGDNYHNPSHSFAMQSSITALVQSLGLNVNPNDWNIPDWQKSLRKRISWALYLQEKWISLALDIPSHITINDWGVDQLDESTDFRDFSDTPTLPIQGVVDFRSGNVLFLQTIELSKIVDQIIERTHSLTGKDYIKSLQNQDSLSHIKTLLEYIKPLQIMLTKWESQLPNVLNIESNPKRGHISSTPNIYIANFTAKIAIFRPVLRAIALIKSKGVPVSDAFLKIRDTIYNSCYSNFENSVRFLGEMKAEHFQTFWYASAKYGFSFLVIFGFLIRLIARNQNEYDVCSDKLDELIWKLKINSKNGEFLRHSILWWNQLTTVLKNNGENNFKDFTIESVQNQIPRASESLPERHRPSPDFETYLSPRLNTFDVLEQVTVDVDVGVTVSSRRETNGSSVTDNSADGVLNVTLSGDNSLDNLLNFFLSGVFDSQAFDEDVLDSFLDLTSVSVRGLVQSSKSLEVELRSVGLVQQDFRVPRWSVIVSKRQSTGFVVSNNDNNGISFGLVNEFSDSLESFVECQNFGSVTHWVVGVTTVVNSGTFNHDEETLVGVGGLLLQSVQSKSSVLLKRWEGVVSVQLVRDVLWSKQSQEWELNVLTTVELSKVLLVTNVSPLVTLFKFVDQVSFVSSASTLGLWNEVTSSTTHHEVDGLAQFTFTDHLSSDFVFHLSAFNVSVKDRWSGVSDSGVDNQSGGPALLLKSLHDGTSWFLVGVHTNGTVVGLVTNRESSTGSSRVGDSRGVGGSSEGTNQVVLKVQNGINWQVISEILVTSGQGNRSSRHSVWNHEDDVELSVSFNLNWSGSHELQESQCK